MKCPHCGKLLPDHAVFCGKCGKAITVSKMPRPTPPEPQNAVCSNCGSPLSPGAAFCSICGKAVPVSQPTPPVPPEPQNTVCSNCGSPLSPDAAFCSICGKAAVVSQPPKPEPEKKPKTKRSKRPLLIAVCVLVLAAAGFGAWMVLGGGSLSSLLHRGPQPLGPCTSVVCSYDVETDTVNQEFYDENGGHLYTIATDLLHSDSTLSVYDMYGNTTNTVQSSIPLTQMSGSIITSQSMEYNSDRQIQSITSQNSYGSSLNVINSSYVYDDQGKLLCVRNIPDADPLEATATTYTYNSAGQPLQELTLYYLLDEVYEMTRYVYNSSGLVAQKTTAPYAFDYQFQTVFYTYDDENRVSRQVTLYADNYNCEESEYNADGQLVYQSVVDTNYTSIAQVLVLDYNPDGTLSTIIRSYPDGGKHTTSLTYTDGNLTGLVKDYGASGKTEYAFTNSPELAAVRISSTDEPPLNCSWAFSDTGTALEFGNGSAELNQDWNLTSHTVMGDTWTHEYDENQRLIRSAGPDADDYEERQYNEKGLLSSLTGPYENCQYSYNEDGNLIQLRYSYGNLVQLTDVDASMSYTLSYDDSGSLVSVVAPGEGSIDLSYDGYLLTDCTINEGDRQETHYTYSSGGLLTGSAASDSYGYTSQITYNTAGCTEHYYESDGDGEETNDWWSYDSVTGMPVSYSVSDRIYRWEYDQAGRLISEEVQDENTGEYWKDIWTYDSAGRVISSANTAGSGTVENTYSYDENGLFAE